MQASPRQMERMLWGKKFKEEKLFSCCRCFFPMIFNIQGDMPFEDYFIQQESS